MNNVAVVSAVVLVVVLAIRIYKWLPTRQRKRSFEGIVTAIKGRPGGRVEVALTHEVRFPLLEKDILVPPVVCFCTRLFYFKADEPLPEMDQYIRAQVVNRKYWLSEVSLDWVESWEKIESDVVTELHRQSALVS
jgi:hypothetical protein